MNIDYGLVIEYIEKNLYSDISLESLANHFSYSKYHFSRGFNRVVGYSINNYINRRRLSEIALELKNSPKSLDYIANKHNYKSTKYLTTRFKDMFGITPSFYRKNNVFINIQSKRIIKEERKMRTIDYDKLIYYLTKEVSTKDDVLDFLTNIDTCHILSFVESDLEIIFVDDSQEYDILYHININLISGRHSKSELFTTRNMESVIINRVESVENEYAIEFLDTSTDKRVTAKTVTYQYRKIEHLIQSVNNVDFGEQEVSTTNEFDETLTDNLCKDIMNSNHHNEVLKIIESSNRVALLKSYNSEYVIYAITYAPLSFKITGMYFDLKNKEYEFIPIYISNRGRKYPIIKTGSDGCYIMVDGVKHLKASIESKPKDYPNIKLHFPNGYSGNGSWYKAAIF